MIACVKTWTYPPVRPWANHLISQFPRVSVCMCVHVHMSMHSVMFDSLGPMDREAWQAAVHEVPKNQTLLSNFQ